MDEGAFQELASRPGADTRQWVSIGLVLADSGDQHSVRYEGEDGKPLPQGVLVDVKLVPSGIPVPCRVLMRTSGVGEAEWDPIGPGDEVVVLIPEGDERAGCVIIGRLNNSKDVFPDTVAGQKTNLNNAVFRRYFAPYILESGTAIQIRNDLGKQQLAMPSDGSVVLNSGDKHALLMNSSVVTLQLGDQTAGVTLDAEKSQFSAWGKGTKLLLDNDASHFMTGGSLSISTSGLTPAYHAATTESTLNMLSNFLLGIIAAVPEPAKSALQSAFAVIMNACIVGCVDPSKGNIVLLLPALQSAFTKQSTPTDPYGALALVDLLGVFPGVGRLGITMG